MHSIRTVVLAVLMLGSVAFALPGGHAQTGGDDDSDDPIADRTLAYHDFVEGRQNWTAAAATGETQWRHPETHQLVQVQGWHVGRVRAGVPSGYDINADANVTSPTISLEGKRLLQVIFYLQGGSDDADTLSLLIQENGSASWSQLAVISGTSQDYASTNQVLLDNSALSHFDGKDVRLRFRFASDDVRGPAEAGRGWSVQSLRLVGSDMPVVEDPDEGRDPVPVKRTIPFDICRSDAQRAAEGDGIAVDLIADQAKAIRFRVNYDRCEASHPNVYLVGIQLNHSGAERKNLILDYIGKDNEFVGQLPVDDRDFVVGDWNVTVYAFANNDADPGNPIRKPLDHRFITVTASAAEKDVDIWLLGHENQDRAPKQKMGPGSQIRLLVDHENTWPQLQKVTYQLFIIEGSPKKLRAGPELELQAPYVIDSGILGTEGEQVLFIRGYDRAMPTLDGDRHSVDEGQSAPGAAVTVHRNITLLRIPLSVDNSQPTAEFWLDSEHQYQDVPFTVHVNVSEPYSPDYTLRFLLGGEAIADVTGANPGQNHTFTVKTNRTGPVTLTAIVTDSVNLTTVAQHPLTIKLRDADTSVTDLVWDDDLGEGDRLIGNQARLQVNLTQHGGFDAVDMNVEIRGPDLSIDRVVTVAANRTSFVKFQYNLTQAGPVTLTVNATPTELFAETTPGNQEASLDFEVYLGRVDVGEQTFLVTANSRGQPNGIIDAVSRSPYDLLLRDIKSAAPCNGAVYTFDVGQDKYCWNPLQRDAVPRPVGITTLDGPIEVFEDDGADNGIPAAPAVGVLALLAAVAAAGRRRQ